MAILKPYPTYKDTNSSIPWIGAIPSHWKAVRLRSTLFSTTAGLWGDDPTDQNQTDHIRCIRVADFDVPRLSVSDRKATMRAIPHSQRASRLLAPGDVLIEKSGGGENQPVGRVVLFDSAEPALTSNFVSRLRVDYRVGVPKFLVYLMDHLQRSGITTPSIKQTTGIQNLDEHDYLSNKIALPPLDEQRAIADFLDAMDAKITRFIAARRRMIALLEEQKQAIINRAVTRGLDPEVPLKPSGIDWLGDIPAHWDVAKIKQMAKLESGHTPSRTVPEHWLQTNDIPWVSLNDTKTLAKVDYISETARYINERGLQNSSARVLPSRTVVFTRDATIGKAAITTRPMAVSQHLIAWICGPRLNPEFLLHVLYALERELESSTFGATIRTIGMDDVRKLTTPVPPLAEQIEIVRVTTSQRKRINAILTRFRRETALLQQYRTRLIADVVTGKLDVQGVRLPAVETLISDEIEQVMESGVEEALADELEVIEA